MLGLLSQAEVGLVPESDLEAAVADAATVRYASAGPYPGCPQTAPGHARRDPAVAASCPRDAPKKRNKRRF